MSQRMSVTLLLILTAAVALALIFLLLPRIPQPEAYHLFADRRSLLGMPNFGDVALDSKPYVEQWKGEFL